MRWVVPVLSVALVLIFLAGCRRSSAPTPFPTPPSFATHLPFPTVMIVPTHSHLQAGAHGPGGCATGHRWPRLLSCGGVFVGAVFSLRGRAVAVA